MPRARRGHECAGQRQAWPLKAVAMAPSIESSAFSARMQNPRLERIATGACVLAGDLRPLDLHSSSSLVARVMRAEVEEPPTVVPFQRNLAPRERHLRVRIERADVRPRGRRILLRIGERGVVRVRRIAGPGIARHAGIVVVRTAATDLRDEAHRGTAIHALATWDTST